MNRIVLLAAFFTCSSAYAQQTEVQNAVINKEVNVVEKTDYLSVIFSKEESVIIRENEISFLTAPNYTEKGELVQKGTSTPSSANAVQSYTYPQFYLSSLAYHSPNLWSFWLNGKKITPENIESFKGVVVNSVSSKNINITYSGQQQDRIDFINAPSTEDIKVNDVSRTVSFNLKPNQTFSTYKMKVFEGQIEPYTINSNEIKIAAEPKAPVISEVFPTDTQPPTEEKTLGLEGLINRSEKIVIP